MNRISSEATILSSLVDPLCRFRVAPILLSSLAALAALAVSSCKKETPPPPPPVTVVVAEVVATNVPILTEFIGQLDSPQNVEVRARVEAFVDKVLFIEGTNVSEGDPLFALDKKPFLERLAASKGMLEEAKAALNKYQKDVDRLTPLADKRAIPQQDLDNAIASVDVGKANVTSAEARVESATIDLGYCDVRAPKSGLIGAKQVSEGSLVGKGEPTLLATISQLDPIWFYCNVGVAQYLKAQVESRRTGKNLEDLPITLILETGAEHPAKGKILFLDRAVDVKTGTLRVRASFPSPEKILRPGMFARIRVDAGFRSNSIVLPERALLELQGKNFVWVIGADNLPTQREVKVGETIPDGVVIAEGLNVGERVVIEGLQKLRKDVAVTPKTAAQMAEASAAQADQQAASKPAKEGTAKHGKE